MYTTSHATLWVSHGRVWTSLGLLTCGMGAPVTGYRADPAAQGPPPLQRSLEEGPSPLLPIRTLTTWGLLLWAWVPFAPCQLWMGPAGYMLRV